MGQQLFLLEHQRGGRSGHHHPADADLEGAALTTLGPCSASGGESRSGADPELTAIDSLFHVIPPPFRARGL